VDSFPGQKITISEGQLDVGGVEISGIAAAHDEGMTTLPSHGSDYIFVIEIGGFCVAHFGDIGQKDLTSGPRPRC
jgi:L-ascorbate metabolism protein UlaG (beta-lactamase superfamily)